mmetsp:Transcript_11304/g.33971  ORF Transcript_11304/g.33971 Transcript_11304/m.33971 type:complete len:219 (+) Transcript_11304:1047-1703(+)
MATPTFQVTVIAWTVKRCALNRNSQRLSLTTSKCHAMTAALAANCGRWPRGRCYRYPRRSIFRSRAVPFQINLVLPGFCAMGHFTSPTLTREVPSTVSSHRTAIGIRTFPLGSAECSVPSMPTGVGRNCGKCTRTTRLCGVTGALPSGALLMEPSTFGLVETRRREVATVWEPDILRTFLRNWMRRTSSFTMQASKSCIGRHPGAAQLATLLYHSLKS